MTILPGTTVSDHPAPRVRPTAAEAASYGRYRLLERVGGGTTAEVWKVMVPGTHGFSRVLAIKRLRPAAAASPDLVAAFEREACVAARLLHPNLVETYELDRVDDSYHLTMEHLEGQNLAEVLAALRRTGQAFPAAVAVFVAREVARALEYLHTLEEHGRPAELIHGDICPTNIMLLRAGAVKVIDLGAARPLREAQEKDVPPELIGGGYVAPELIERSAPDARADVFSLGAVLWEMLVGRPLFRGGSTSETLLNLLQARVPAPSGLLTGLPEALDDLVLSALAREPGRRCPSARAFADQLERIMLTLPTRHRDMSAMLTMLFDVAASPALAARGQGWTGDSVHGLMGLAEDDTVSLPLVAPAAPETSFAGFPSDSEPTRAQGGLAPLVPSRPDTQPQTPVPVESMRELLRDERAIGVLALALIAFVAGLSAWTPPPEKTAAISAATGPCGPSAPLMSREFARPVTQEPEPPPAVMSDPRPEEPAPPARSRPRVRLIATANAADGPRRPKSKAPTRRSTSDQRSRLLDLHVDPFAE